MAKTFPSAQGELIVPWEAKSEPICLPTGLYLLGFEKGPRLEGGEEKEETAPVKCPFLLFFSLPLTKRKEQYQPAESSLMHLTFQRNEFQLHTYRLCCSALSKHWHQ